MAVTDPVDARLLAALAEVGKAAVHEVAARVGMDPKEVAYRLVGLSASGFPLLVGVESDPNGLRAALSGGSTMATGQAPAPPPPAASGPPMSPTPSAPYPVQGAPSGPYQVQGSPSGPYPPPAPGSMQPGGQAPPHQGGAIPGGPSGAYPAAPQAPPQPRHPAASQAPQAPPARQAAAADPVLRTWGPPQTAGWARNDQPGSAGSMPGQAAGAAQSGSIGDTLESSGLEGETLAIQLLEVQDPADFLFGAAGYQLAENERAVVVHTEITNRGRIPFVSLPDNYLELLTSDGRSIAKDPMSLTSRPPHKIGVQPGETAGGHTVYVLPSDTRIIKVRWSPRPEADERSRTWSIED